MPTYRLQCEKCAHTEEYYFPLSSWDKLDMSKGETPYPQTCPKCKHKKYLREGTTNIAVKPDAAGAKKRVAAQVREDLKQIARGDMNKIQDIAGTGSHSGRAPVKYMKDVKKGIKRV